LVLLLIVAGAFAYLMIKSFTQKTETKMDSFKAHWTMRLPLYLLLVAVVALSVV
jgi:hypothetical protein